MNRNLALLVGVVVFLVACTSTGVVPMDHGTYMIGRRSAQAGLGPPLKTQAKVYREANEFCAKQNQGVETIKLDVTDGGFGRPGAVSLQFKCVGP